MTNKAVAINGVSYPLSGSFDSMSDAAAHPPTVAPKFNIGDMVTSYMHKEPRAVVGVFWRTSVPGFSGGRDWLVSVPGFMAPESEFRPA